MGIQAEKIRERITELARYTATPGNGVTRFPFTEESRKAGILIGNWMREAGLSVRLDNTGSIIGRLEGEIPETVMIGSHMDSVKNGGAYDGAAGVICAVAAAAELQASGFRPYYSLEVIATNDEEGSRFRSGLFSPRAMLGQLGPEDLRTFRDDDGISVYEAMRRFGLDPEKTGRVIRKDIAAFLEIHIEQGPVLEAAGREIGIVDTIAGIRRYLITVRGRADHVGTTPMRLRRDALSGACRIIARLTERAAENPPAVATVGSLRVEPNIINIIPAKAEFTADIRAASDPVLQAQHEGLMDDCRSVCSELGLEYEIRSLLDTGPVPMSRQITDIFENSCIERGFSHMHLVSGAGHDAMVFGAKVPAAMLFVPSTGGRSHCPEEHSDERILAMAAEVAADTMIKINQGRIFQ